MAEILKGFPAAKALTEELKERTAALAEAGTVPTLCVVRLGEKEDDLSYEAGILKRAESTGVNIIQYVLPEEAEEEELLSVIRKVNEDSCIHGCLMFRPLYQKELEQKACELLRPEKDVDGMTAGSLSRVFTGKGEGYPPCTAESCMELLKFYGVDPKGKKAVVIGRSLVIGKPVSMMLLEKNATVTICHTKTENLAACCREADILVAAAGQEGMVTEDFMNDRMVILDVGIHVGEDGKLTGDVQKEAAETYAAAVSPVPGGVGSVTTAVLMKHVVEACERQQKGN